MASILRLVTNSSSSTIDSTNPVNDLGKRLAKWTLVIGVPTAVCVAAYLVYRQQQDQAKKKAPLTSLKSTTITSSVNKAGGDATSTSENRVKVKIGLI